MKRTLLTLSLVALASPAFAGSSTQPTSVVELFTSQGCSSCPPANRFVTKLSDTDPDVLALSYGVTYWDYLGWEDTFGDPAFTARQAQYRDSLGSNMYTPQMVIAGATHAPRFRSRDVKKAAIDLPLVLAETATGLRLSGDIPPGATLALVQFEPGTQSVAVKRGENHGRTLTLANVVTAIDYAPWTGPAQTFAKPDASLAVLVHAGDGAIIGAVRFDS